MQKKESYKHILPHFQLPGQAYFVTWCLKDAIPAQIVKKYSPKLNLLKLQIDSLRDRDQKFLTSVKQRIKSNDPKQRLETADPRDRKFPTSVEQRIQSADPVLKELQKEYYALRRIYFKAVDDFLDVQKKSKIDLIENENLKIISEALEFWQGRKLETYAFCIMTNHVHWVFKLFENDEEGNPVYLQDIMHSVKRTSANKVNKLENRIGPLWQKESYDTTIRDEKHLYNAIEYTLNNPVKAGLVKSCEDWPGIGIGSF
jgi:REP element-mobilizing transposase RayT